MADQQEQLEDCEPARRLRDMAAVEELKDKARKRRADIRNKKEKGLKQKGVEDGQHTQTDPTI